MARPNRTHELKTLGRRLAVARSKAGLYQEPVERQLDKYQSWLSKCESGDIRPTVWELRDLAEIYGVTVDWLLQPMTDEEFRASEASIKLRR